MSRSSGIPTDPAILLPSASDAVSRTLRSPHLPFTSPYLALVPSQPRYKSMHTPLNRPERTLI
jgi:hypothetical protein